MPESWLNVPSASFRSPTSPSGRPGESVPSLRARCVAPPSPTRGVPSSAVSTPEPHPGSPWVVEALWAVFASATDHATAAAPASTPAPIPAPTTPWRAVLQAIQRHRVTSIIAPHANALGCPADVAARLHELHVYEVARAMKLVHDTADASAALAVAEIDHLLIKGAGLAVVMGGRPVDRGGGDIDLWVRPHDVARSVDTLCAAGWERSPKAPGPLPADVRRWRWMLREDWELPLVPSRGGQTVDLHWRLLEFEGEFTFGFEAAMALAVPVPEVGPTVRTLCAAHALEHAAAHARKEGWLALRQVADVVRVARMCEPDVVAGLVERSRNVRLGVAMAARLDPQLGSQAARPLGLADRRLVNEAWASCLAFGSYRLMEMRVTGWPLVVGRARQLSWVLRSAPGWGARRHHLLRLVGRSRVLVDRRRRFWHGKGGAV
jgi:hypothetical protein